MMRNLIILTIIGISGFKADIPEAYRNPPQLLPLFMYTPEKVNQVSEEKHGKLLRVVDEIVATVPMENATFENTVLPTIQVDNEIYKELYTMYTLQYMMPDPALREASMAASRLADEVSIKIDTREDYANLVKAAFKSSSTQGLKERDPEAYLIISRMVDGYKRNGIDIPAGPKRDRFVELMNKMVVNLSKYNEQKVNLVSGIELTPDELKGVSNKTLAQFERNRKNGDYYISFTPKNQLGLIRELTNATVREKLMVGWENRCNESIPIYKEVLKDRHEISLLLGYKNYAEVKLATRMARTPEAVMEFLTDLKENLESGKQRELDELLQLKKKEAEEIGVELTGDTDKLYIWDWIYYTSKLVPADRPAKQFSYYFPYRTFMNGMMETLEGIFSIKFVRLDHESISTLSPSGKADDIVWNPDVEVYSVWNDKEAGNDFLGYLFLELFNREGKRTHPSQYTVVPGFENGDKSRTYPVALVMMGIDKSKYNDSTLLGLYEVRTIFHECGHAVHTLVSRTKYGALHGTNVATDFVEAPSQMLENWAQDREVLNRISSHVAYESPQTEEIWRSSLTEDDKAKYPPGQLPPRKIPKDVVDDVMEYLSSDFLSNQLQLALGFADMAVHQLNLYPDPNSINVAAIFNRIRLDMLGMYGPNNTSGSSPDNMLDYGHQYACFGHLMAGYAAGYYGYFWSQVYSLDMYAANFAADPMNPASGLRYRKAILEPGGSVDMDAALRSFLGRPPNKDAFYKKLGIA